jgi:hypothetical protein
MSSGVVGCNVSTTTQEDHEDGQVSDFAERGVDSGRIQVPGTSGIYLAEDLQWENDSVGNEIRPALVKLPDLSDEECRTLLDDLQTMNLGDEWPLWEIPGAVSRSWSGALVIPLDDPRSAIRREMGAVAHQSGMMQMASHRKAQ